MEPRIQYAKTSDGVSIAWFAVGQGLPYVWPIAATGDLEEVWRIPESRALLEGIAHRATLISYNLRGFGLSDRGPMDYSCEAMVRDLEAVVESAGVERFTLQMWNEMSIPALYYASSHPDRLFALVLLNGLLSGQDTSPGWKNLIQLATTDWERATRLMIQSNEPGWELTQTVRQDQFRISKSTSRDAFLDYVSAVSEWDGSDLVGRVTTPTLVLHWSESEAVPHEASRRLAAALPNGSFASVKPAGDETTVNVASRAARGFLRDLLPRSERRPVTSPTGSGTAAAPVPDAPVQVILFADIADSTALTERFGDSAFRAKSRELDGALRAVIREHAGICIDAKTLGDGVLATFSSASQAIAAALACGKAGEDGGLPLHLGMHAGDVIREDNNVFGGAVNVAARISGLSAPGEVLVSDTVRSLARTSAGVSFEDRGEQELKGVGEAVRVWAVREVE